MAPKTLAFSFSGNNEREKGRGKEMQHVGFGGFVSPLERLEKEGGSLYIR